MNDRAPRGEARDVQAVLGDERRRVDELRRFRAAELAERVELAVAVARSRRLTAAQRDAANAAVAAQRKAAETADALLAERGELLDQAARDLARLMRGGDQA